MVSKLNANRQPGEAFGSAMGRIYKDIGFPGLWNGLVIRIFMIGTLTSLRKYNLFKCLPQANGVTRMGYLRQLQDLYGFPNNWWCRSPTKVDRKRIPTATNGEPLVRMVLAGRCC